MLTGRIVRLAEDKGAGPAGMLKRLVARSGEPFIRQAVRQAMKILGDNFVLGRTIKEALSRAAPYEAHGYRFSYDMLGERAKTAADADRYFDRYMAAIEAIGEAKAAQLRRFPHADGAAQRVREAVRPPSALRARQGGAARPRAAAAAHRAGHSRARGRGSASPSMPRSRTAST